MSSREQQWLVPVALVGLSAIPLTAGVLRLIQLTGGPALIPADHRFAGFPLPLVLLYVLRLVFGSAMAAFLVLGVIAGRRRDLPAHRAWMIRAYAIGLAAGTQAFTDGLGRALFDTDMLTSDLPKGAGWAINLAIAEWAIRRPAFVAGPQRALT